MDQQTQALTVTRPSLLPSVDEIKVMRALANDFLQAKGKLFPNAIDSPAMLYGIIEAGREVGISPMAAIREVFVVNGRTELSAKAMEAVVMAREPQAHFVYEVETADQCKIVLHRPGKQPCTSEYKLTDVPAKLRSKETWKEYGIDMLRWFTLKRLCRKGGADLINVTDGVSIGAAAEIIESTDYDIEGTAVEVIPPMQVQAPAPTQSAPVEDMQIDPGADAPFLSPTGQLDWAEFKGYLAPSKIAARELVAAMGLPPATEKVLPKDLLSWRFAEPGRTLIGLLESIVAARTPAPATDTDAGAKQPELVEEEITA
jgi:hypothetical protein